MNGPNTAAKVKKGLDELRWHIPAKLASMGWYFSTVPPTDSLMPDKAVWRCMFSTMEMIAGGQPLCFSPQQSGCGGASCYLGFSTVSPLAGRSLAEKEGFKKTIALGNAFYKKIDARPSPAPFLNLQRIDHIDESVPVEVVLLWTDGAGLSTLVTLANYDRADNDNVVIPFASGCQSIWTIPFKEAAKQYPKAVVGCIDPAVRPYIPADTLSFALPARRFIQMTANIAGSFLEKHP